MTTEQLLVPRYKVIADYPNSPYKIGEIYTAFKAKINITEEEYELFISTNKPHADWDRPEEYPVIFKKLEWWEERDKKDLPKYVKLYNGIIEVTKYDIKWGNFWFMCFDDEQLYEPSLPLRNTQPATEEEYLNQNK